MKLITKLKESNKDIKKCLDFMMAATIFVAAVLELISWRISLATDHGIKTDNLYVTYWYPLITTVVIWVFSVFFIVKAFRYKSCIYTTLVSIIYFLILSYNISAYLFKFGIKVYTDTIYPVFIFSILGITILKITRWLLRNRH